MKIKSKFKLGFFGLATALIASAALAANIGDDTVKIGRPGSTANKTIQMGAGRVLWNQSTSKLTFSNDGGTSFKNLGSGGGGGGGINLLTDFNFDFEGGLAGWTASGGSFTSATSGTNLIFDAQSGVFNASAASQTVSSTLIAIPEGFKGANGSAACYFKTTASDYKLQVFDGTNVLAERLIPIISGAPQKVSTSFVFPNSGSVRLRVISASDAADLAMDNCHLGETQNIQLSQATEYAAVKYTSAGGCSAYTVVSGVHSQLLENASGCTKAYRGQAQAVTTSTQYGLRVASLPKGKYYIALSGTLSVSGAGASPASFAVYKSTGPVALPIGNVFCGSGVACRSPGGMASFEVTSPESNVEFVLQGSDSGGGARSVGLSMDVDLDSSLTLYKFPAESDTATTFGTVAQGWSGVVSGTTALTSATLADFPGTPVLTEYTNVNAGTVTISAASNGITLVPARTGEAKVCVSGFANTSGTNASGAVAMFKSGVQMDAPLYFTQAAAGGASSFARCNRTKISAIASTEFKLQGLVNTGDINLTDVVWSFEYTDQQVPAPVVAGGVVSPSAGVMNMVSVAFAGNSGETAACTTDPCVIARQSGGVTSVNRISPGAYDVNFAAGTFSAPPVCVGSRTDIVTVGPVTGTGVANTSTVAHMYTTNSAGTASDDGMHVMCFGPK